MATILILILVICLPVLVLRRLKSKKLKAILNGIFELLFGIGCFTIAWFLFDNKPKLESTNANPEVMFARSFNDVAMYGSIMFGIVAFIFCLRSIQRLRSENSSSNKSNDIG